MLAAGEGRDGEGQLPVSATGIVGGTCFRGCTCVHPLSIANVVKPPGLLYKSDATFKYLF